MLLLAVDLSFGAVAVQPRILLFLRGVVRRRCIYLTCSCAREDISIFFLGFCSNSLRVVGSVHGLAGVAAASQINVTARALALCIGRRGA